MRHYMNNIGTFKLRFTQKSNYTNDKGDKKSTRKYCICLERNLIT